MNNQNYVATRYYRYSRQIAPLFKEKKIQAYTLIILSLFTISFFGFLAIRPTLGTIITLKKQIQDRTIVNSKLEDKINALIQAQSNYQQIESDIPIIYTLLPQKPDITSLLLKIEAITAESEAIISALTFDRVELMANPTVINTAPETAPNTQENVLAAEVETDTTIPISFTITFSGTYDELKIILAKLGALNRIVTIKNADLNISANNEVSSLTLDMQTAAHYFPIPL